MTPRSPFFVIEDLITPKTCETIISNLGLYTPNYDSRGNPLKITKSDEQAESVIFDAFEQYIPSITKHYKFEYLGSSSISFEMHTEGTKPTPTCENSSWVRKKWLRHKDVDFTVVIFLVDGQEKVPFDVDYEVYGGKLEFLQHHFGFIPQRGTAIIYPSGPHFLNAFSEIRAGDLYVAKFHITAKTPYMYDPSNFPGDYTKWFK